MKLRFSWDAENRFSSYLVFTVCGLISAFLRLIFCIFWRQSCAYWNINQMCFLLINLSNCRESVDKSHIGASNGVSVKLYWTQGALTLTFSHHVACCLCKGDFVYSLCQTEPSQQVYGGMWVSPVWRLWCPNLYIWMEWQECKRECQLWLLVR